MKQWATKITSSVLATMRYCYEPLPVSVNEEEWSGGELGGVRDYLVSLVYDERKKNFIAGYLAGALATWEEVKDEEHVFRVEDAMVGAERAWQIKDKEEC